MLAFYDLRRRNLRDAKPNAAHFALARLEDALATRGETLTLVTQNIDDLHERAGSASRHPHARRTLEGALPPLRRGPPWLDDLTSARLPGVRARKGVCAPMSVWFGEMPLDMA